MEEKNISVAVDGPVGAGKSSVAKDTADRLGYVYCDTGALYRVIALYCLRHHVDIGSPSAIAAVLPQIKPDFYAPGGSPGIFMNDEDVTFEIRLPHVSMAASTVSAVPEVRASLRGVLREIAGRRSTVMDGRDIGTAVLPNASVKIFLTASPEVRAQRRYEELTYKRVKTTYESVLKDLNQRDYNDSHRAVDPLRRAKDAVLLDTTYLNFQQATLLMSAIIVEKTQGKEALGSLRKWNPFPFD